MTKTFKHQVQQLATEWSMSVQQLAEVGGLEPAHVERVLNLGPSPTEHTGGERVPPGLEPLANLIGLQERLARTFADKNEQHAWLLEKNDHFDGLSPLDVMRTGPENTQWLSYYLETRLNFAVEGDDS